MAIVETGVELTLADPSASCSLISPQIYRDWVRPYHQEIVDHFKKRNIRLTLHMCGYIDPIMEDLVQVGFDRIEMDGPSSLKKMVELSQKRVVIRGNISAEVFAESIPEQVEEAVRECIEIAAPGSAYILSQGCSIPFQTPMDNIKAFWEAGLKYGCYEVS
jgi:uroporphyrinogen decarboxylase